MGGAAGLRGWGKSLNGASLGGENLGSLGAPDPHPTGAHLGVLPQVRAHAENGLVSQKMQTKDPPQAGPGRLSPARTWAPTPQPPPRDEARGRARTMRGWARRAAQLRPAGCVTRFTALTRLCNTTSEEVTSEFWLKNHVRRSLFQDDKYSAREGSGRLALPFAHRSAQLRRC